MDIETVQSKKLYKSRHDRMVDGVCAGIAEYVGIDTTILRVLWILSIFIGGAGILLYIAAMIIIPVNPEHLASPKTGTIVKPSQGNQRFWGMMLIVIGLIILLTNLGMFAFLHIWQISLTALFAFLLIVTGLYFIFRTPVVREQPSEQFTPGAAQQPHYRRFERVGKERKLLGVCGGIARYFDIDPSIVRMLYVFFTFISHGFGIIVYFALALILPEEKPKHA
jgi:phage shock protein C